MPADSIETIDEILTEQLVLLEEQISKLKFVENFVFTLGYDFDLNLLSSLQYSGVYLVEIKTIPSFTSIQDWMSDFLTKWEDDKYIANFVPNSRISRVRKHSEYKTWFPIYLGRAKNISDRIKMHVYKEMNKPTGALKLRERKNIHGYEFRISSIKVDVKNYDLIVPQVEKYFRNEINPILGRQ
ncbi:hypothetical protein [Alkaliflexus imshenetskii]|uniref:hypothetical protein n=1 Tax=Alkaliflexus imshenetskii TaxID=286730 RepID=UPI00047DD9BA|nr:hypothetical protein [Alkaliflexus imshenetskii]